MQNNLENIRSFNAGEVQARLDNDKYSINVSRNTWKEYLAFDEFIKYLTENYFTIK